MKKYLPSILVLFFITKVNFSQSHFQLEWQYKYNTLTSPWSLDADALGRPYLYAASGEAGLRIFTTAGVPVVTIDTNQIAMSAINFTQVGNLLYVAIGRNLASDLPGLAIIDVANPTLPVVKDIWIHSPVAKSNGAGIVKVEGNYAYLGAMGLGLVILNISDPNNIVYVSELALDINYPSPNPTSSLYNLRGMEVKNSIVYACFDAGGLRIINCTNKNAPKQTGQYANPITYVPINRPRAYNNLILDDTLVYVAVDYCGVEVLNIKDTSNIKLLDHFNSVNCPTGSWYNAAVHANELKYNAACKELFVTTGKSEMISFDVSNPSNIDSTGMYGSLTDTTATWGIGMRNDSIFLSYILIPIYIPFLHPFDAKWNGIKMIKWTNPCSSAVVTEDEQGNFMLRAYPNPFSDKIYLSFQLVRPENVTLEFSDVMGRTLKLINQKFDFGENSFEWDGIDSNGNVVPTGIYFIRMTTSDTQESIKILKVK